MRLALFGNDQLLLGIAQAVARERDIELTACYDTGELSGTLHALAPAARFDGDWENLLIGQPVDVAALAPGADVERSAEQLKRLAQSGVPVLALHPACDVMAAYEIELIRRETQGFVEPYVAGWTHPAWGRLQQWVADAASAGGSGPTQVRWERYLRNRSRSAVLKQFARDEMFLRRLIGPFASVNAVGHLAGETEFASLSVFCTGTSGGTVSWSVAPPGEPHSRIALLRADRSATLFIPTDGGPWRLQFSGEEATEELFPEWDAAGEVVEQLRRAAASRTVAISAASESPTAAAESHAGLPTWNDACLSLETLDAVERSLRRKRSIDMHVGERSEEATFKGYMAAVGCLILLMFLLGFIVLAVVEGFRVPLRDSLGSSAPGQASSHGWPLWARLWPVYPLIAFLLLQLLVYVARRPGRRKATD